MDDDGDIQLIEFDEDVITLDLPEEKVQNWKIIPRGFPEVRYRLKLLLNM